MSFEKLMKVFSPDGRIYQTEYAFKAVNMPGYTSISVKGNDAVVVCTQKKIPDKLIVADSVTNIFNISDSLGAVIVGSMPDARFVVQWLQNQASDFKFKFKYEVPVHVLAQRLSQQLQKFSQYAGIRPFCVMVTLVGCDEEFGPQVYKIDPSGQSTGYKATASGSKEQEANTQLEKHFKKNEGRWNSRETVEVAIQTLQQVISSDFKANEIEVGFATTAQPRFRKMTE